MRLTRFQLVLTALCLLLSPAKPLYAAATITLVNSNPQCAGFNDPTPATGLGGNYAITKGQQRLNAFQYAANLIAQHLNTGVEIKVDAQMNALGGSAYSATLGQAGPMSVVRDFTGAPFSSTYYPIALAETLYGADLNGGSDIVAEFNSDVDGSAVLGSLTWYYGFDQGGGGNIDYITVVQHELLHGLGFLSLLGADGSKFYGYNDSFLLHLERHAASPADLKSMTNSQRASAMVDTGNLHWTGAQVVANSGSIPLVGGVDGSSHVFMYAPASYSAGSSVSHFSNLVNPNEDMEPFYTGPDHTAGLAVYLLQDIGWSVFNGSGSANLHLALSDSGNRTLGDNNTYTLTVTNNGTDTATQTMVTYMVPHGHRYISSSPACRYANRVLSCALGDIAGLGGATTVTVVARMDAAGTNTHSAVVSSATTEGGYSDNRVALTTTTSGTNDLALSMTPQSGAFTVGSNYTYTATVTNPGASAATNLALHYDLPAGLTFVSAATGSCCNASGSAVQCHVAELGSNSSTDISFVVNAQTVGSYTATSFLSQNQTDVNNTNNSTSLTINIAEQEPDACFIATAAYGSLLHKDVKVLRHLRDRYLRSNSIGKIFVGLYYKYSPPLADKLRHNEMLRALMRGSLGPLVALGRWLDKPI